MTRITRMHSKRALHPRNPCHPRLKFVINSARGFDTKDCAIRIRSAGSLFRSNVNVAVRPLLHVTHTNRELRQQRLAALGLRRLIERDTLKLLPVKRSHEQVVLPSGELVARVENDARWADR